MAARPRLYLLDVEGTVAPISLVTEQLFPYARIHFQDFIVRSLRADPAVRADLALLAEENKADSEAPRIADAGSAAESIAYLHWLMDRDRKSTALKSLQGKIWKAGFESGELKGTLFADVPPAFSRWAGQARIAIYSSGSVQAQQLLFRYSIFGDLTPSISAYFDTRTGAKRETASYRAIASAMEIDPASACFFSDVVAELDAAREAGFETRLVLREGNAPVEDAHEHIAIDTLEAIP